jgi:phosphopantetheinyl transferase (holo-ACP synthase)
MRPEAGVGNDVIDLDDPEVRDQHRSPRFLRRICSAAELSATSSCADPRTLLWSLFAAKEAAYKLCVKLWPGFVFIPARVEVDSEWRFVRHEQHRFELRLYRRPPLIHACVWSGGASPIWAARALGAELVSARDLLRRTAARALGKAEDQLEIFRAAAAGTWDGFGPPELHEAGRRLEVDVSLSHDGRYAACALVPS